MSNYNRVMGEAQLLAASKIDSETFSSLLDGVPDSALDVLIKPLVSMRNNEVVFCLMQRLKKMSGDPSLRITIKSDLARELIAQGPEHDQLSWVLGESRSDLYDLGSSAGSDVIPAVVDLLVQSIGLDLSLVEYEALHTLELLRDLDHFPAPGSSLAARLHQALEKARGLASVRLKQLESRLHGVAMGPVIIDGREVEPPVVNWRTCSRKDLRGAINSYVWRVQSYDVALSAIAVVE
jgi:hypothetical protein